MIVNAIKCPECGDTIFSRTRHDCRWCGCGGSGIDGGRECVRIMGRQIEQLEQFDIEVDATPAQLFADWNERHDLFGKIKENGNG